MHTHHLSFGSTVNTKINSHNLFIIIIIILTYIYVIILVQSVHRAQMYK